MSTLQMLFTVFDFVFPFWPVMVVTGFKGRGHFLKNIFITWGFLAAMRILMFFNPEPQNIPFMIPEPLSTILFFVCGIVLAGLLHGQKIWQRRKLRQKVGKVNTSEDLFDLSPREFEDMVVELFEGYGHKAKRTGKSGDHGVDVIVQTKNGEKCVVQCKRWRKSVGEPVVRDFYGTVLHEKADRGIIIASGKFSRPAREWVKGKPIALYDGEKFLQLWQRTQTAKKTAPKPAGKSAAKPATAGEAIKSDEAKPKGAKAL